MKREMRAPFGARQKLAESSAILGIHVCFSFLRHLFSCFGLRVESIYRGGGRLLTQNLHPSKLFNTSQH